MRNVLDELRKHTIIFVNEKSPYLAASRAGAHDEAIRPPARRS